MKRKFFLVFVAKLKKSWSEILENDPLLYIVNIPLIWAIYGNLKADKIVNQLQRQGHYQISREDCKKNMRGNKVKLSKEVLFDWLLLRGWLPLSLPSETRVMHFQMTFWMFIV